MNTGIFYLYEYSHTQKLRNAGFLKITRHYHSCTLQLHARDLPVSRTDTLKLCAFFMEHGKAETTVLAEISCTSRAVSARLNSAESQFPGGRPLNGIDGFLLPLPNGNVLAAAMPDTEFDTQTIEFIPADVSAGTPKTDTSAETPKPEHTDLSISETAPDPIPEDTELPVVKTTPDSAPADAELPVVKTTPDSAPGDTELSATQVSHGTVSEDTEPASNLIIRDPISDLASETEAPLPANEKSPQILPETKSIHPLPEASPEDGASTFPPESIRKIQRSDLSVLPRRYWNLANNSFLLHGYHNYNHLLLIEEDGHYWLGIPGIYDARESRAAELFGFPQFTDSYNDKLQLSPEEYSPYGTFGYWCRYLK